MTTAKLCAVILCLLSAVLAQTMPLPPLEGMTQRGCSVEQFDNSPLWHVHVWADYADGHKQSEGAAHGWIRLLTMRDDRDRALKDCSEFMKATDKLGQNKGRRK